MVVERGGPYMHYLGPNNVNHMAAAAEKDLDGHRYNGESRNYLLERHILTHLKAHAILEDLKEISYHGINERSKVRKFVDSIKTKLLDTIKGQIMASADLRTDFDKCTTLFKVFLPKIRSMGLNVESQWLESREELTSAMYPKKSGISCLRHRGTKLMRAGRPRRLVA
jgi:hypothetical protein